MSYTRKYIILLALAILAVVGYFLPALSTHSWSRVTTPIAVVLLALPALYGLVKTVGIKRAAVTALTLGTFGMFIETVGIYTCFPYGCFQYGADMGGKLLGTTPWTVAFAWAPLVLGAYGLVWKKGKTMSRIVAQGTLLLVAIDLILDPVAAELGFWIWESPGLYYGIPFVNFLGWVLSGAIGMYITAVLLQLKKPNTLLISTTALSLALWLGTTLSLQQGIPLLISAILLVYTINTAASLQTRS